MVGTLYHMITDAIEATDFLIAHLRKPKVLLVETAPGILLGVRRNRAAREHAPQRGVQLPAAAGAG